MRAIFIIPARGGSKGIPGKNLVSFNGRPLLSWTVEAAMQSEYDGPVVVTTDNAEIGKLALESGAEVVERPAELAADDSPTEPAVIHAILEMERRTGEHFDPVVLLQPTSPGRTEKDINGALELFFSSGADSLLSVFRSHTFFWRKTDKDTREGIPINYDYRNRPRRQEMEQFAENGAIYVTKRKLYMDVGMDTEPNRLGGRIVLFEMPPERSLEIDDYLDLALAETVLSIRTRGRSENR